MVRRICSCALLLSLSLLLFAVPGRAQTATAQPEAPSPVPQLDPKTIALAKDWLHRVQTANIDRSQLTDRMSAALTPSLVQQVAAQLAPLGDPTAVSFLGSTNVAGITIYHFLVTFKAATVNEFLGVDGAGKIAGLRFTPAQ